MKKLLMIVTLLSSNSFGYVLLNNQHLPQTFTYSCPDSIAEVVAEDFCAWNTCVDNIFTIRRVNADADVTIIVTDLPKPYNGLTLPLGNKAVIQLDTIRGIVYSYVILHEFGHAFGLGHSLDKQAIMCATAANWGIGQDDVDAIRDNYSLSPKTLTMRYKIHGHTFVGVGKKDCFWILPNGNAVDRRRLVLRLPKGTFTITLIDSGIEYRKEVIIK